MRYALAALLLLGPALGQAVRTTLTPGELERLLASLGWKYEQTFDWGASVEYRVEVQGDKFGLFLANCEGKEPRCLSLMLRARPDLPEGPSLEHLFRVLQWNRDYRFSRAYVDEGFYPVLEADLLLEGGVTDRAIVAFFHTFLESWQEFVAYVSQKEGKR
ncbi:YbjN domain-containing protein [Thermus thalpophilus]|uniref:YbjN domain-containing protein n=1 Tax=Thermus thalpophilus TaxID=2908147 RepID=UPI001FAB191B|nr:YbjN domain-containing protein [Thermus thalpophilus]